MRTVLEGSNRLDQTLSLDEFAYKDKLSLLVQEHLLKSPLVDADGKQKELPDGKQLDDITQYWSGKIWTFLDELRSASGKLTEKLVVTNDTAGSAREWKLKDESDVYRVMYREGPVGTPFHTLCLDGAVEGDFTSALCVAWESPLYKEWWPQFILPTFKITESKYLRRIRVGEDLSLIRFKIPWPMASREVLISAFELEYLQEDFLLCLVESVPEGVELNEKVHGFSSKDLPAPSSTVRIAVTGGFIMQRTSTNRFFFRTVINMDMKLDLFPPTLINFISRQVAGQGLKLYQKAVLNASNGTGSGKRFQEILKNGPMYNRIRAGMEAKETEKAAAAAENSKLPLPQAGAGAGAGAAVKEGGGRVKGLHGTIRRMGSSENNRVAPLPVKAAAAAADGTGAAADGTGATAADDSTSVDKGVSSSSTSTSTSAAEAAAHMESDPVQQPQSRPLPSTSSSSSAAQEGRSADNIDGIKPEILEDHHGGVLLPPKGSATLDRKKDSEKVVRVKGKEKTGEDEREREGEDRVYNDPEVQWAIKILDKMITFTRARALQYGAEGESGAGAGAAASTVSAVATTSQSSEMSQQLEGGSQGSSAWTGSDESPASGSGPGAGPNQFGLPKASSADQQQQVDKHGKPCTSPCWQLLSGGDAESSSTNTNMSRFWSASEIEMVSSSQDDTTDTDVGASGSITTSSTSKAGAAAGSAAKEQQPAPSSSPQVNGEEEQDDLGAKDIKGSKGAKGAKRAKGAKVAKGAKGGEAGGGRQQQQQQGKKKWRWTCFSPIIHSRDHAGHHHHEHGKDGGGGAICGCNSGRASSNHWRSVIGESARFLHSKGLMNDGDEITVGKHNNGHSPEKVVTLGDLLMNGDHR